MTAFAFGVTDFFEIPSVAQEQKKSCTVFYSCSQISSALTHMVMAYDCTYVQMNV